MIWRREIGWHPGDIDWRVAVFFMVGATLFALGSFPAYSQLVNARAVGVTFVAGSVFFTVAAFDQLEQARRGGEFLPSAAAAVQFVGTLLFNINTSFAMVQTFDATTRNRLVWGPDFVGSVAFLIASHLAWRSVCRRLWCVRSDDPDWWSDLLNYLGSVFFMASALAAYTLTTTGEPVNITVVNVATFAGAACFFFGAYLLLPPVREGRVRSRPPRPSS